MMESTDVRLEEGKRMEVIKCLYDVQRNDEPFSLVDLQKLTDRFNLWKQCLPDVECCYAVKANGHPEVIKHLYRLGGNFDCASQKEIEIVINAGATPEDIMFSAPQKFPSHITSAEEMGVKMLVFDCEEELLKIKKYSVGKPKCIVRVNAPVVSTTYTHFSTKFGCSEREAMRLISVCSKLGLDLNGISFHVGHCTNSPEPYRAAIQSSKKIFDEAKRQGHSMEVLDIGGGFPGPKGSEDLFIKMAEVIRTTLRETYPSNVRVIGEPGLFLMCNMISTYAKVIGVRKRNLKSQDIFLNCGIFSGADRLLFDHHEPEINIIKEKFEMANDSQPLLKKTVIWGPTCDPHDWLVDLMLPDLEEGDKVEITNAGAYTINRVTPEFSGYPNPNLYFVNRFSDALTVDDNGF